MSAKRNLRRLAGRWRALAGATVLALAVGVTACSGNDSTAPLPFAPPATATPATAASTASPITATATATSSPTPPSPAPSLAAADGMLRDGRFEEAADAYLQAARGGDAAARAAALLGAGVAQFNAGDAEGSRDSLRQALAAAPAGSSAAQRAAYLLGFRLNEAGSFTEAATVLAPIAESATSDTPFQQEILAQYARAAGRAGESAAASSAWARLLGAPALAGDLRRLAYSEQAWAAADAGDGTAQAAALGQLVSAGGGASARYALAFAARALGDQSTFAGQLRAIVGGTPASRYATLAVAALHDAGLAVDPGLEGLVAYRRGDYAAARRVLEPASHDPLAGPADLAFRTFYLAAAFEDGGQLAEAVREYDRAASYEASSPYTHRAKYWAARVTESLGNATGASARYLELALNGPAGEFSAEAAFRAGYTLLRAGNAASALETWAQLGANRDARLLYWEARAREREGNAVGAHDGFAAAASTAPLSFWGLEAARRTSAGPPLDVSYRPRPLSRGIDWPALERWLAERLGSAPPPPAPTAVADLLAVGLTDRAREALLDGADSADAWRLLQRAREASDLGLPDAAATLAFKLAAAAGLRGVDDGPVALLQLAYPLAYVETLDQQAKANDLDPLFVAAVIRQESFWDATAGSSAGALGLTQVIPPTGEAIARALGFAGFKPEDLFRPAVSLRFGVYYLAGQLRQFGTAHQALAAYNAGPGNAQRWTAAAGAKDAADFVAAVDIPETEGYVTSIMEHYARYLRAWAGQ